MEEKKKEAVKKDKKTPDLSMPVKTRPIAKLSSTSNPKVFLDKEKGELYYLSETPFFTCLRKLNEGK